MIKKTYYVRVSNPEVDYINNHFKYAKCEMAKVKGNSYNMLLTYGEQDKELVDKELKELVDYKIIEFGL